METKEIKLKCGIVIEDNRELGLGVRILEDEFEYASLYYKKEYGFYISTKGCLIDEKDTLKYIEELKILREAIIEATVKLK